MRIFLYLTACLVLSAPNTLIAQEKEPVPFAFKLRPVEAIKGDDELAQKLKERYNDAIAYATDLMLRVENGRDVTLILGDAMDLLVGAGLELFTDAKNRLAVLEESLRYAKHVEEITELRFQAGIGPKGDVLRARYIRLTAEIRLLREKQGGKR